MADQKYATVQQYVPLRKPSNWNKEEKAFIVQVEETFDDIYRRFGRLRLEDMSKTFRKRFTDAEGNITEISADVEGLSTRVGNVEGDYSALNQTVGALALTVADKYDKVSGITITSSGVDINGNKYVKLTSGGHIDISNWKYNSDGLIYDMGNNKQFVIANDINLTKFPNLYAGLEIGNGVLGGIKIVYATQTTPPTINSIIVGQTQVSTGEGSAHLQNAIVSKYGTLGDNNNYWDRAYITSIYYKNLFQQSSRELKEDIQPMPDDGDRLDRLEPVTYRYKDDEKKSKRYGLIYEDTVEVMPEICSSDKKINYTDLVPVLLKEIQSLRKRVAALEGK